MTKIQLYKTQQADAAMALSVIMTEWQERLDTVSPEAGLNQAEKATPIFTSLVKELQGQAVELKQRHDQVKVVDFDFDVHKPGRRVDDVEAVCGLNQTLRRGRGHRA